MTVTGAASVSWEYSVDGENFSAVGQETAASAGVWVGVKAGLCAFHQGSGEAGSVTAEYFVFSEKK